ncbi:MAG: AAA family ATPase [Chloroflexota bacterium]|nr:AAA family ATPase [Chloroflexota bacterium]
MITQIEIDGFKSFKNFKVELAPFQVIVGPNGSGKSNLFDALQLLSRLMETDLSSAFLDMRGDANELFTKFPDGQTSKRIFIAVEMLVNRKVQDDWGREAELQYTHLRYELELERFPDSYQPYIPHLKHEALKSIAKVSKGSPNDNSVTVPFITTISENPAARITSESSHGVNLFRPKIELCADPIRDGKTESFVLPKMRRTALSSVIDLTFPHAFAAREILRSLKFLHLNPDVLRQSSSVNAPQTLSAHGGNLPTVLARMQVEDRFTLGGISRDLANLVPDLTTIELKEDKVNNEYTIWATYQDGRSFSSRVLSDGTLQLLTLVTLKNDPQFSGVLCFEEPENGVHPSYLTAIAHLLRELATDFNDSEQAEEPLRQVLVTTHSPTFISQPDARDALLLTYTMTRVEPTAAGISPMRFTHAASVLVSDESSPAPVSKRRLDKWEAGYTIDQVKELLTKNHLDETLKSLDESRVKLSAEE